MIPVTRKELYLNKIVGNDDYSVPEKPISEEELFFAEILGEAVQAPEPLTRYQMYLAKIAGRDIEIPTPITRLEYFLAKAAGMDITVPVPITREEIYWSNYTAIVEFEVENVPPLTYKAIEGTLKNYRIYGNTVNGESVGDLITEGEHAGEYSVPVTVEGKNLFDEKYDAISPNIIYKAIYIGNNICTLSTDMPLNNALGANLFLLTGNVSTGASTPTNGVYVNHSKTVASTNGYVTIAYRHYDITPIDYHTQLEKGSTATAYEPYRTPVTTPIYLPEPLKMVGDEAEYIDYAEQKQHFADGTSVDVTLPALPTLSGTNTLSVGTEGQPSKVYIKGEKEREYT